MQQYLGERASHGRLLRHCVLQRLPHFAPAQTRDTYRVHSPTETPLRTGRFRIENKRNNRGNAAPLQPLGIGLPLMM